MRYNDKSKFFFMVISMVASIIGILLVMMVFLKTNVIFENIQIILGILIALIAIFITYTAFIRIRSLEERFQDQMHMLMNQTSEVENRLVKTLKGSINKTESIAGFSHLQDKVEKFVNLYPYEKNVTFLSSYSGVHSEKLYREIKIFLGEKGYKLLRASDLQVASDIFSNVVVHLLASKYGIALFDVSEDRTWANPNVSFELGIMFTLGRKVLLLKDARLPTLPTDIAGHIYNEYKSSEEIPKIIERWLTQLSEDSNSSNENQKSPNKANSADAKSRAAD